MDVIRSSPKAPLTGAIACSNSGGYLGAELKFAGYDMIIFEGKAKKPVYLYLIDGKAELLDASEIWGTSVWDTDAWIKTRHQEPQMHVAAIGVAGENQVLYSCIINDLHRGGGPVRCRAPSWDRRTSRPLPCVAPAASRSTTSRPS